MLIEEINSSSSNQNKSETESEIIKSIHSEEFSLKNSLMNQKSLKIIIFSILFGQLLSLLCVGNGYFAQYIQNKRNIVTPLLLNSSYYILIFILYGIVILKLKIQKPKIIYIILSIYDTQANYIFIY